MTKLSLWVHVFRSGQSPLWSITEFSSDSTKSPTASMCSNLPMDCKITFQSPVVQNTLKIWHQCRRSFGFAQMSISSPIIANSLFQPGLDNSMGFKSCFTKDIVYISDLFVEGIFPAFDDLVNKFDICESFFKNICRSEVLSQRFLAHF